MLAPSSRPIVLLGNLEPVAALSLHCALVRGGISAVIGPGRAEALVDVARRLQPDAVVLGLEAASSRDVGAGIRRSAPGATIMLLARDEVELEVLHPDGARPLRVFRSVADRLAGELGCPLSTRARSAPCPTT